MGFDEMLQEFTIPDISNDWLYNTVINAGTNVQLVEIYNIILLGDCVYEIRRDETTPTSD
tara:strand:- start:163 stop:342 length:180 start_codon:yes stop_codon:yes gene_type:complete